MQIIVADDGPGSGEIDRFEVNGTRFDDQFLLRANDGGDALIALLNENDNVERINFTGVERIIINGGFGEDHFAIDDTNAEIIINGGPENDTFQVGQMFRSPRTDNPDANISDNPFDDQFATIETTRGWLSNGISEAMTINGGDGNDTFIVFHNKAVLQLNGNFGS